MTPDVTVRREVGVYQCPLLLDLKVFRVVLEISPIQLFGFQQFTLFDPFFGLYQKGPCRAAHLNRMDSERTQEKNRRRDDKDHQQFDVQPSHIC